MSGIGLGLTLPQITGPLGNVTFVIRAVAANFILAPLLAALVALLAGLTIGKAWERYKLRDGRWIDRRRLRETPHYMLGLNFLTEHQVDQAIEACTATVTGVGGLNESVAVTYASNINVGTASASATFAGDANHDGSTGTGSFSITKATSSTSTKPAASS